MLIAPQNGLLQDCRRQASVKYGIEKAQIIVALQLKKEITEEITSNMSTLIASAVTEIKSPPGIHPVPTQPPSCSSRARAKPYKWSRKLTPQLVENISE